jgi:hypothetical protein
LASFLFAVHPANRNFFPSRPLRLERSGRFKKINPTAKTQSSQRKNHKEEKDFSLLGEQQAKNTSSLWLRKNQPLTRRVGKFSACGLTPQAEIS